MEPESNTSKPTMPPPPPEKKVPMYLIAVVITLAIIAILLGIKLYTDTVKHNENLQYVEGERAKLERELNDLIVVYDTLKTQNDSLAQQLEAEQERIRTLLKRQASSTTKIKMYQRELETLRKVMKSYIVQIDSLNTRNRELTEENVQVRQELQKKSTEYEELSIKTHELSETVRFAQKLIATNIVAEGLNRNSKPKDRISKIEKIRVCFTIRENAVAEAGNKTIYLRISRPDEVVLSSPEGGIVDFDDQSIAYSAKRDLDYANEDIDLCVFWDATEELIPGTYFISLYAEGYEIGSTSMALK
jgi:FtsZ-binding cell division protein ZapB